VKKFWVKGGLIHFSKLELSFFEKFSIYLQNRSVSVFFLLPHVGELIIFQQEMFHGVFDVCAMMAFFWSRLSSQNLGFLLV